MHSSTRGIGQQALLPSDLANDFDVLAQVTDKEEKSSIDKIHIRKTYILLYRALSCFFMLFHAFSCFFMLFSKSKGKVQQK